MTKIAPHLNSEVRLVLGGLKPLATIEKVKDPYGFALAISLSYTGALNGYMANSENGEPEVIVVRPSNKHLIMEYLLLLKYGVQEYGQIEYHRKMGRIFGYSEEDITAFINSDIHCSCSKCNLSRDKMNAAITKH